MHLINVRKAQAWLLVPVFLVLAGLSKLSFAAISVDDYTPTPDRLIA